MNKSEVKSKDQLLLSYNKRREPLGIQPRNSFLNSSKAKVVVWAFIFTEDKKLLLHRRKENAKDNRGLWDKSAGGHVERSDLESSTAVAREVAEELYTDERFGSIADNKIRVHDITEEMKFLGEWGAEKKELCADEVYFKYYRVNFGFSKLLINSYRILPNGEHMSVSFFVDAFFFLAPKSFTIQNLYNSDYYLVSLPDLKKASEIGFFPNTDILYKPTPDLSHIMELPIWNDLVHFSECII